MAAALVQRLFCFCVSLWHSDKLDAQAVNPRRPFIGYAEDKR